MKKSTSQTGSAHMVIIIVIVLAVIGALGYVLWNNMNKPKANNTQTSQNNTPTPPAKKSEIVTLQNSDMNKYVNYEQGFEFEFPKVVYSGIGCTTSTTVLNTSGQQIPVEPHYNLNGGSAETTILESVGRYIITTKNMVVLSNYTQTSDGHYLAHTCDVKPATVGLADTRNEVGAVYVDNTATKEFDIVSAKNDDDITAYIRKITGDNQATIGAKGPLTQDRQDISIKYGPERLTGAGGYKLWYYPSKQKIVYFSLGQAPALFDPAHYNQPPIVTYDMSAANSFKFATN
jgi:hypothetical protein